MNELQDERVIEILWTGGYDSSFRIAQLSKLPISIKPYYLSDNRSSEYAELLAIRNVSNALRKKSDTLCTLLDLTIVPMSERIEFPATSAAFTRLLEHDFFGSQYEWLGWFSEIHPGIELSVHQDDKAVILINKHGAFRKIIDDTIGDLFVIDETKSDRDIVTLFRNFHFPLYQYTKRRMKDEYARLGCEDIVDLTWFCFTPVDGKPCGTCNPCKYTIEEGLSWRFPPESLKRYKQGRASQRNSVVKHAIRKVLGIPARLARRTRSTRDRISH